MSQPHLCFFSKRCPFSQQFLEALSKTPYSREFRFICVDPPAPGMPRPQLPAYVKAVPTLMIKGEPEPRTDSGVMNWLAERRLTDRSVMNTGGGSVVPTENRGGRGKPGQANGGMQVIGGDIESSAGGPAAFMDSMCGAGDEGFCYIGEMGVTPTSGSMSRLAGNMVSFNDPEMMGGAPPAGPAASMGSAGGGRGSNGQSAKSKALDDAMTQMMARRSADFAGIQRR
jgi:hypothetical protein